VFKTIHQILPFVKSEISAGKFEEVRKIKKEIKEVRKNIKKLIRKKANEMKNKARFLVLKIVKNNIDFINAKNYISTLKQNLKHIIKTSNKKIKHNIYFLINN
jgi:uncharacterized protein YpuA (DUF1002 family)